MISAALNTNYTLQRANGANQATFYLGSNEPMLGGFVDKIQGAMNIIGGGNDVVKVDDTGAPGVQERPAMGFPTSTTLTGMGFGYGITYSGLSSSISTLGTRPTSSTF